jgi:GNAT superfamily N-acetyltransferase
MGGRPTRGHHLGPALTLSSLTNDEYAAFVTLQAEETAHEAVTAGEWTADEAPARARLETADLRADTLRDSGHAFYRGVDVSGERIGWLWVAPAPDHVARYGVGDLARARWLAQVFVEESRRGRGYGAALLGALHRQLADQAVTDVFLRVYDWNTPARRLYATCGYEVVGQFATDAHLRRRLDA